MSEEQQFADFEVEMDFTETQAWGGEDPIPPPVGTYNLQVQHLEQKTIGKGTPAVVVTYVIVDNVDESLNGRKVWNNYPLTTKAMGRLKSFMVAGGGNLSKFSAGEYLGVTILADIIHSQGDPQIGADGTPKPPRTFANVINERPLESAAPAKTAEPPPVMNKPGGNKAAAATTKPANGAGARRA